MRTHTAPDAPVTEIVTFRLVPGTDPAAFRAAAMVTDRLLSAIPAYGPRALTCDEAGLWTDIVRWSSLAAAQAAAEAMMASPECAPFLAMLDMESVSMRHAAVIWARD